MESNAPSTKTAVSEVSARSMDALVDHGRATFDDDLLDGGVETDQLSVGAPGQAGGRCSRLRR